MDASLGMQAIIPFKACTLVVSHTQHPVLAFWNVLLRHALNEHSPEGPGVWPTMLHGGIHELQDKRSRVAYRLINLTALLPGCWTHCKLCDAAGGDDWPVALLVFYISWAYGAGVFLRAALRFNSIPRPAREFTAAPPAATAVPSRVGTGFETIAYELVLI